MSNSNELETNLANYKVQLSQVEAALTADPENDELKKLKGDLEEVIQLTKDLVGVESSNSKSESKPKSEPKSLGSVPSGGHRAWKVGDRCLAIWNKDGKYYRGRIEEILPESATVAVIFDYYEQAEVCQLTQLKQLPEGDSGKPLSKKELAIKQREYRKKKNQKKKMKAKEKEAESEISKHRWKEFHKKASTKSMKGCVKRSIFASPEGLSGRVGIGTCGTADKDMTKYGQGAKYNARHLVPR